MSLLFVGPAGDAAERTLEQVGRQVVLAVPAGTPLTELWGKTSGLSRRLLDQELAGAPHCLYFGHGDDDGLGDPLLVDDVNVGQLKGRIVLALACSSARFFGGDAVTRHGVLAYLGFTRPIFVPLPKSSWVLTPWYVPGVQLVSGATTGAVRDDSAGAAFRQEGDRLLATSDPSRPDFTDAVNDMLLMYGTAMAFVCQGDLTATV